MKRSFVKRIAIPYLLNRLSKLVLKSKRFSRIIFVFRVWLVNRLNRMIDSVKRATSKAQPKSKVRFTLSSSMMSFSWEYGISISWAQDILGRKNKVEIWKGITISKYLPFYMSNLRLLKLKRTGLNKMLLPNQTKLTRKKSRMRYWDDSARTRSATPLCSMPIPPVQLPPACSMPITSTAVSLQFRGFLSKRLSIFSPI